MNTSQTGDRGEIRGSMLRVLGVGNLAAGPVQDWDAGGTSFRYAEDLRIIQNSAACKVLCTLQFRMGRSLST